MRQAASSTQTSEFFRARCPCRRALFGRHGEQGSEDGSCRRADIEGASRFSCNRAHGGGGELWRPTSPAANARADARRASRFQASTPTPTQTAPQSRGMGARVSMAPPNRGLSLRWYTPMGCLRVYTSVAINTRTDRDQTLEDKVARRRGARNKAERAPMTKGDSCRFRLLLRRCQG